MNKLNLSTKISRLIGRLYFIGSIIFVVGKSPMDIMEPIYV